MKQENDNTIVNGSVNEDITAHAHNNINNQSEVLKNTRMGPVLEIANFKENLGHHVVGADFDDTTSESSTDYSQVFKVCQFLIYEEICFIVDSITF